MKYSAIILSGGDSKRFKEDKGLFKVFQKTLITYIIETVTPCVDDVMVITSLDKVEEYSHSLPSTRVFADESDFKAPISGALTGFKNAIGDYSLLLPCDTPLISKQVISMLIRLAPSNDAVVPRWPNGYIEPLQAIYRTKEAYRASMESIASKELMLINMISRLKEVLYLSTTVIKQLDKELLTFHNINVFKDLEKIQSLLKTK
ncbi:MAG: molybdenum cofactor guanylyltransferase [Candidatus Bathyarchaeota archaeon]|nr:molybdenum cofactor guanylyltransferase [Candidatus Bathyarchaeota archaeon]